MQLRLNLVGFNWTEFPINMYGDIAKSLLDDEKDKICKMH